MKEIFGALVLFFCMTVISIIMFFSKFESGVENFWEEQEGLTRVAQNLTEFEVFDIDNTKISEEVDENQQNSLLSK